MPDPTLSAIDRIFDLVDSGVDHFDRVFNRGKQTEERYRSRRAKRPEVIDAESAPKRKQETKPAASTSIAGKPRFYIVESIASSGTLFVVTDGGNARTECATREFAEKILRALEALP